MASKNRVLALLFAILGALVAAETRAAEPGPAARALNLNTASVAELETLPGVGESRAKAIVEAREKLGGFKSIDDLEEVKGIGKAALEKLRPLVTAGPRTPGGAR
ncbi:hypothetical protein MYXO_00230 [Myxococcaceae bacterium]|jgi:competence protein ComEA|nr:hypothetical protein MYXO_00230 [Myxococcaceae bacterium]